MSRYFLILLACFILTLPLEFVFRAKVYRRPLLAAKSISLPIFVYLAWDVIATHFNHWNFATQHRSSITILGLPFEEILFFIIIPFCALLTYESVKQLHPKSETQVAPKIVWAVFLVVFFLVGFGTYAFRLNEFELDVPTRMFPYYFLATLLAFISFLYIAFRSPPTKALIKSNAFFYTMLICCFFMIFVNGYLTILDDPVVSYRANLGPRMFFDKPVEDFFYGFVLLSWILGRWVRFIKPKPNVDTKI
jgi:lycopene cyclase domain-containing protein